MKNCYTEDALKTSSRYVLKTSSRYPEDQQMFAGIFIAFLEFTLNFEHFEKKFEPHRLSISEIINSERRGYLNI